MRAHHTVCTNFTQKQKRKNRQNNFGLREEKTSKTLRIQYNFRENTNLNRWRSIKVFDVFTVARRTIEELERVRLTNIWFRLYLFC